jgi:hypothetical protein
VRAADMPVKVARAAADLLQILNRCRALLP